LYEKIVGAFSSQITAYLIEFSNATIIRSRKTLSTKSTAYTIFDTARKKEEISLLVNQENDKNELNTFEQYKMKL